MSSILIVTGNLKHMLINLISGVNNVFLINQTELNSYNSPSTNVVLFSYDVLPHQYKYPFSLIKDHILIKFISLLGHS